MKKEKINVNLTGSIQNALDLNTLPMKILNKWVTGIVLKTVKIIIKNIRNQIRMKKMDNNRKKIDLTL
jgi:hypothetical protein